MSDTNATAQNAPPIAPIRFLGQFIRDLSFEVPHAPGIFQEMRKRQPEIPVTFDAGVQHLQDSIFEVTVSVNIRATIGDRPAFIMELVYATMVEVDEKVITADQLHPVLFIEIPRFLFPFVRQIIGDLTISGGFPPLFLQPVDFGELYARKFGGQQQPIMVPRNTAAAAPAETA